MNFWHHWAEQLAQMHTRQRFTALSVVALLPVVGFALRLGALAIQQTTDVQYGDTVNGQLAADGTQDWHFIAASGDRVGIHIVRTSGDLVAGVALQDSDGQPVVSTQAANSGDLSLTDVALSRPGAYTIHVFSLGHTAGNYQLTLTNTVTATALPTPISQAAAGSVQYGQAVQGHLDAQTYQQFWRLTGSGGDVIDVQMRVLSGDLDSVVALLSPGGDVITASASQMPANSTSRDATIYSAQLPRTGNYTILARRSGDQQGRTGTTSGSYSLTVTAHTVALNAADSLLAPGDTLIGHLTTAAPISQYRIESGGVLGFRLELGSLHRIARVRLLDSAGTELLSRQGLSPLAFSAELPVKGPFFIQITSDSYDDQPGVDFALSSYKINALSSPLRYGDAQHGLTAGGNAPDRWFFVGHTGDLIHLQLTPDSDALDKTLTLSGPQDIILFHGTIGPQFDQPFSLPADGAYQIAVQNTSDSASPFGYQVLIDPFGARNMPFAAAGVTSSKGVLAFGKSVNGTLTNASDDTYTLDASAGQALNVTVTGQTTAQPLGVLIRAPDESLLSVQTGTGAVRLHQAILPAHGRYSVIVFDPSSAANSPYSLQIEDAGGGTLTAGQSVKGVLLPGDSLAEWSIDAPTGALLNARLSTRTPAAWTPSLYVIDPSGFVLAHASVGLDKTTLDLTGVSAPIAGRYRFVVAGTVSASFASYELLANVGTPFAPAASSTPVATPPPAVRFAPVPGTPIPAPPLADLIDPPLPLDTSANVVQPLPLNTLARGEIPPGGLRQLWRLVSAAGNTLAIRAVTLNATSGDAARGPDLALFDGATGHIVAEQLHGDTPDTILTYYSAQGGAYFAAVRLALGSGRYTLYAAAQSLAQGALQIKQGTPLIYGQSVLGELQAPDQTDAYYFYGSTNDVINPSVARVIGTLSPGLALITPGGQTLVADTNKSLGASAALGATRLPETGVYTLQVRHADLAPQTAGRYLLSLELISGSPIKNRLGGLLTPGQIVTGALSPNNNQNTWLLSGHAADHLSLVASGLSLSDSPAPLSVQIQDTSGQPFAQADIQLPQDTARLTDVLLPADGIYRVQVSGGQTQGGYQLAWLPASNSGQLPGAIRYGQTISGLFTTSRRADKITFAGTAGDVIALSLRDVRGDPFRGGFQLLSAGGVALATAADLGNGEGARIDGLTLPLTGTYTIIAANPDSAFKGAGVYALGLTLQDSKARGMGGLLRDGDHGSGELYPDDPLNTWLFVGHSGDVITAQVTAGDHFLQPQLTLQTTAAQTLAQAVGDSTGNASITSFKLPADGVYALAVTGANQTAGSYRISLSFTPPPLPALATIKYGSSALGLIADDRPTDLYLFKGQQGDSISAKAVREPGSNLALTLELQSESGDLLAHIDALGGDTASINGFILPETGTYRLVVGRFNGISGHTSGRLNVTLDGQPATFVVRGKLTTGQTVLGRLDDSLPADRWTFVGRAGQVVSLTSKATSGDLDTFLTLQAPDGSILATNDDFSGTNAVLSGVPLRTDGTYTVILSRVGTRAQGSAGNYELRLDTLFTLGATAAPQAVIGYGQRVVGTLDNAHTTTNWTFAADQGSEISVLLVHPTDDAPPSLSVQDPSGTVLATGTLHVGQTTIDSYRIPTGGLFNLAVKRPVNARAAYTPYALTLTLLGSADPNTTYPVSAVSAPNTSSEQVIAPDETVQGTLGDLHPFDRWTFFAAINQTLSAEMLVTDGTLQPALQLIGPDGKLLVDSRLDQTPLGLVAAIDTVTIPATGEYQWIAARSGSASTAGSYTLSFGVGALATETLAGQPIKYGQTVQNTITPAHSGLWVFTGQSGDAVDVIALPGSASQDAPSLNVTDAGGNVLAHADPVAHESAILSLILPGSGRYVVMLTAAHATGYTLLVQRRQDTLPTKFTPRVLVKGTTLENGIQTGSLYDFWTFNAQADAPAQIVITRLAGNLRLDVSLYGPRGYLDGKTADANTDKLTLGPLKFPQTGTYTVVIGRWLGAAGKTSGRYTILWSDALLPFPTPTPDAPLAVIPSANFASAFDAPVGLSAMGQAVVGGSSAGYSASLDAGQIGHLWTFDAQQSPTIALTLSSKSAGLQLSALIVDAAGQVIGHAQTDSSGTLSLETPLPSAGRYTLQIMPLTPGQTGSYQFQLAYALSQFGGGRLVSGETVAGTLNNTHFTDDWRFDAPAGAQITIDALRTSGTLALAFDLIGPDGTTIAIADNPSGASFTIRAVSASSAGTYRLLISRQGGAALPTTGSYQLQFTVTLPTF